MNDAQHRPAGQIPPMETVTTSKVGEEHADPTAAEQPRASALEAEGASARAHEIRAPNRDTVAMPVAPRGSRGRSVGLVTGALIVTALGLGWIGGSNSYRLLDLKLVWPVLQQELNSSIRTVASGLESVWNETVGSIAAMAGMTAPGKMAGQDPTSETPNTREVSSRMANDLDGRPVDGRESSQGAARDLTIRVEQVREATERSQREIVAGLGRLGERLERVEDQLANLSATKSAPSVAQQNTSSARPAVPVQRLTPGAAAKISPRLPSAEAYPDRRQNAIEGWTIREIFGGTAVLAGPEGIRRVSPGDTVPGLGRVDSVVRRGSRWVVTTSRGVITTD